MSYFILKNSKHPPVTWTEREGREGDEDGEGDWNKEEGEKEEVGVEGDEKGGRRRE